MEQTHENHPKKSKIKRRSDPVGLTHSLIEGERENSTFLYVHDEKQFYTCNAEGKDGKIYRCQNRKCKSRVTLTKDHVCEKLEEHPHNHEDDCAKEYKELVFLNEMKRKCRDKGIIASGASLRDIYNQVMAE